MAERKRRASRTTRPSAVVRTERLELLGPTGQVIAVLGHLPGADIDELAPGLVLHDGRGERRLLLTCDRTGPSIHFMAGGTVVLSVGVIDPSPDEPSSTLYLTARSASGEELLSVDLTTPKSS
jgi:hypothetical protein